jgi:hypothetical protein
MKKFFTFIKSLLDGTAKREAIEAGYIDLSGQGRNKYGK